ncbi:putative Flp pilus-assembly TadE/G-like protein [Bacteriovorax sp. BAL6_X]|uniref:Tad domain-containing protein n=1 Tax=Bacteriovorax sp. BAL6_X TaxID=1201290 RepID=UPI000385B728|nr:Tad domain-containing protein [Bacteriovorax sp. BAL6_X]EPZ50147.1 putative Flp pilus-assembly TadE/G-like protein [Bacteriovorax sp. BAL6_X]
MTQEQHSHSNKLVKNKKGQISIFFGVTLVAIFSFIAFVVNVGLFVKAKINLQNAVDSAAWSGAASQARQLTNIAHLNWEMRNTYKEWMFKYYVLGQLANENTHANTTATMNFALKRFDETGSDFSSGVKGDHYNVPSICLHFGTGNNENLCTIYQIPGLPRFHVAGIPDVSEEFEKTMDAFVNLKAKNCMVRSTYNFSAAKNYAFAAGVSQNDVPIAAADRTGAWIESMELALRIRNLEMIVNRPPITQGICGGGAASGCINPQQLNMENQSTGIPINDRPLKAYFAASKSVGGGIFNESFGSSLQNSLVLYELAPKTFTPSPQSLSSFLIPQDASYNGGELVASSKRYLDLVPMIMNFTTFFTTFAPTTEGISTIAVPDSSGTAAEASCASTKTALPVPGYILGFYKNPKVVTYYAVKAKVKYTGLLNPFGQVIDMAAYAAAKPFGGRIGPALVSPTVGKDYAESSSNSARIANASGSRSANFIMGFTTTGDPRTTSDPTDGVKVQGLPLPATSDFFLDAADTTAAIGGIPSNVDVKFTIPNMIYNLNSQTTSESDLPTLAYNPNPSNITGENAGLFTTKQFVDLRANIPNYTVNQAGVTAQNLQEAFQNVRAPTNYDALNYMVPTVDSLETDTSSDHFPSVRYIDTSAKTIGYFAPLFHGTLLYKDREALTGVLTDYIDTLSDAVIVFRKALSFYATKVRNTSAQDPTAYIDASKAIFDPDIDGDPTTTTVALPIPQCQKQSIASRFTYFILGKDEEAKPDNCETIPLLGAVKTFINDKAQRDQSNLYYITTYRQNNEANPPSPSLNNNSLRTGYAPGKDYGGENNGRSVNPFTNKAKNHRRNAYSTKLISLVSITDTASGYAKNESNYMEFQAGFSPEGETPRSPEDVKATGDVISNPLPKTELSEFGSDLYF